MRKKGLLLILILVIGLVIIPVQAKGPKGFFAAEDVTVNEDVDSSLFAAGNTIDVNASVNGNSFVAGLGFRVQYQIFCIRIVPEIGLSLVVRLRREVCVKLCLAVCAGYCRMDDRTVFE